MAVIDLTLLKSKFEDGDVPTGTDFANLIDTLTDASAIAQHAALTDTAHGGVLGGGGDVTSDSPTFTGTVTLPSTTSIGDVDATELSYLNGVTSSLQTQIDSKASLASPTFTGTVNGITKTMVGLGSVDNTSDLAKPVSTATQTALNTKLSLAGGTMTGDITMPATSGLILVDQTTGVSYRIQINNGQLAATEI